MASEIWDDPEVRAWADRVVDELVPMLEDSALTVSIVPDDLGRGDIKMAVELGLSIMLGCLARGIDLRDCEYSIALDKGIDLAVWTCEYRNRPVNVLIGSDGKLVPLHVEAAS